MCSSDLLSLPPPPPPRPAPSQVNFDEELWIPVWVPSMCKRFALTIMHREFGRRDLVVATAYLDFAAVIRCDTDPVGVGFNPLAWVGIAKKRYSGPALQVRRARLDPACLPRPGAVR